MEKITKREGTLYYGEQICEDVDQAYEKFRQDYNKEKGRAADLYLQNLGRRKERIHGFGYIRKEGEEVRWEECFGTKKVRYRLMGLIGIHYVRNIGIWDVPDMTDEEFDRWIEWALTKGSNALTLVGTRDKAGRTNKRFKKKHN